MRTIGDRLRQLRQSRNLLLRHVASATAELARRHPNEEFYISPSRLSLSDFERLDHTPSIYKLYSLCDLWGFLHGTAPLVRNRREARPAGVRFAIEDSRHCRRCISAPASASRCKLTFSPTLEVDQRRQIHSSRQNHQSPITRLHI
jgi:transcriptional regulator with XRE-family HTH domain